jgi:hypothetical protein
MKMASANPQDGYVYKWMCNLVRFLADDKNLNPVR